MTVLIVIGMAALVLLGTLLILSSIYLGVVTMMLSGKFEPICIILGAIGTALIWLAIYLSPFSVTVQVGS